MPDAEEKAKRFRDRAEECRQLAEIATDNLVRQHYQHIAESYEALAEAENIFADRQKRFRAAGGKW